MDFNNKIESKLKDLILVNTSVPHIDAEITEELDMIKDFAFDSISIMKLIVDIENEFNIQIEDDFLLVENLSNYKILKNYIINVVKECE